MGWFLTNATPKRSRKTAAKARKPWDPQRTLKGLQALGLVAVVILLVVGWALGERHLRGYVAQRTSRAVPQDRIELAHAPAWMSPALAKELCTAVVFELGEDPLDAVSLQHAVRALADSPWVGKVDRIERLPGGKARVTAQYRRPVAVVETDTGYQLVDSDGVVLPQTYRSSELAVITKAGLTPIEGVLSPPPESGIKWIDEKLDAALALIRLIEPQPWYRQITSIDASGRDQRHRIRLILHTDRGRVTWGLPPGQEAPIEPDAAVKLQRLTQLYANPHFRSIDANGQTVDIFGAAAWGHQQ